jgi:hypothetical protein
MAPGGLPFGHRPSIEDKMRLFNVRSLSLAVGMLCLSTASFAQVDVAVNIAPPELPVYEQPVCPGDGYIWTPGYWAWGDGEYYWVSGDWVMAPEAGYLWTPGYWGWRGGGFFFNEGYWGLGVGFYGGINYGFGYFGFGYDGGRWDNGHFFYNTAYNRVGGGFRNVYSARVSEGTGGRVSYNGGRGGIEARATSQQEAVANGRHTAPVAAQTQHAQAARNDPQQRSSAIHGTAKAAVHPKDLPPVAHSAAPHTGNAKRDQQYQKQQDQLSAKQNQERQKLQQQQDKEHQQQAKQNANAAKTQQMEQRHQQQTVQMQQRHTQQSQHMQQRQGGGGESHGGGGGHH